MFGSIDLFGAGIITSIRPSGSVATIVLTNCNGSGSAEYPGDKMKTICTIFLLKHRCIDVSASVMANRSVIIASPVTSLLGIDSSVRRLNSLRLYK